MLNFINEMSKHVEDINNTISNEEERAKVLKSLQYMIQGFTTHVIQLKEHQNELEEELTTLQEQFADLQEAFIDDKFEDDDICGTCPYCGEDVPLDLKNGDFADVECPNCHNMIELEVMYDDDTKDCEHNSCGKCCDNSCSKENSSCESCGKIVNFEEFKKEIASFEKSNSTKSKKNTVKKKK